MPQQISSQALSWWEKLSENSKNVLIEKLYQIDLELINIGIDETTDEYYDKDAD